MALTQGQLDTINATLRDLNTQVGIILRNREQVIAAVDLDADIGDSTKTLQYIAAAKLRAKTAAQTLVTVLS